MASLASRLNCLFMDKQAQLLKTQREEIYSAFNKIYKLSKNLKEGKGDTFKVQCDRFRSLDAEFEEVNELIGVFNVTVADKDLKLDTTHAYSSFYQLVDSATNNYLQFIKKLLFDSSLPTATLVSSSQLSSINNNNIF